MAQQRLEMTSWNSRGSPPRCRSSTALPSCAWGRDLTKLFRISQRWRQFNTLDVLPSRIFYHISAAAAPAKRYCRGSWEICQNYNTLRNTQALKPACTHTHTHTPDAVFFSMQPLDTWKIWKQEFGDKGEDRKKEMMEDKTFIKMFGREVEMYERKWKHWKETNLERWQRKQARGWTEGSRRRQKGERKRKKQNKGCDVTEWNATQPVTYLYNINYTAQCLWIMEQPYLTRVNNLAAAWPIVYITGSISAKYR